MTIQGFFTTGDAQSQFSDRINAVFGITDDLTWVSGAHTVRIGGEIRRDRIATEFIFEPNGDYTLTGIYSGNAMADFLLGMPALFRQAGGDPHLAGSSWTFAPFAQNEYRVRSRLTLNYGLRYEVTRPFEESRARLMAIHPGQQSVVFPEAPIGLVYPGDQGVPDGTYYTDLNNIAPRVATLPQIAGAIRHLVIERPSRSHRVLPLVGPQLPPAPERSSASRCVTCPPWISPRHCPVATPRSSMNFLKRCRSPLTRAVTMPSALAVLSLADCGS